MAKRVPEGQVVPEAAVIQKSVLAGVTGEVVQEVTPEPFVVSTCPLVPVDVGRVNVQVPAAEAGLIVTAPLVAPSRVNVPVVTPLSPSEGVAEKAGLAVALVAARRVPVAGAAKAGALEPLPRITLY